MKKSILSKAFALIMVFTMIMHEIPVYASEEQDDCIYRSALEEANERYNVDLEYYPVEIDKVSIEEYRKVVNTVAYDQRVLIDHINNRMEYSYKDTTGISRTTKTVTKAVWGVYQNTFRITATYTVNGHVISNPTSIYASSVNPLDGFLPSSTTTNIIDFGRTLTVSMQGMVSIGTTGAPVIINNVTLYTEFYYNS